MDDTSPESAVGKKSEWQVFLSLKLKQKLQEKFLLWSHPGRTRIFTDTSAKCFFFKFSTNQHQLHPSSCPSPPHLNRRGDRPPRGDTPLKKRRPLMCGSFSRRPSRTPSLWWVWLSGTLKNRKWKLNMLRIGFKHPVKAESKGVGILLLLLFLSLCSCSQDS